MPTPRSGAVGDVMRAPRVSERESPGDGRPAPGGSAGRSVRTRSARSMYWSTLSLVTTGAYEHDLRAAPRPRPGRDIALLLHEQAGQLDAVGGLGRRVDDRRLEHRVVGLDAAHRVRRAGAADHEELVAAGVLDRRQDADALVVVVVPEDVDLRRGLQQVGRRLLAGLDGELGGDPVVDFRPQLVERVREALGCGPGSAAASRCRRSRRRRRRACRRAARRRRCRPRRPCRSCRRGRWCGRRTGSSNSRSTLMTGMPASIALSRDRRSARRRRRAAARWRRPCR